MAQQTAMQNLINELRQFKKFPMVDQPTIDAAIEFAELRLEMEKEQITDAFVECWKANVPDGIECKLDAEQYYNETYGKE